MAYEELNDTRQQLLMAEKQIKQYELESTCSIKSHLTPTKCIPYLIPFQLILTIFLASLIEKSASKLDLEEHQPTLKLFTLEENNRKMQIKISALEKQISTNQSLASDNFSLSLENAHW